MGCSGETVVALSAAADAVELSIDHDVGGCAIGTATVVAALEAIEVAGLFPLGASAGCGAESLLVKSVWVLIFDVPGALTSVFGGTPLVFCVRGICASDSNWAISRVIPGETPAEDVSVALPEVTGAAELGSLSSLARELASGSEVPIPKNFWFEIPLGLGGNGPTSTKLSVENAPDVREEAALVLTTDASAGDGAVCVLVNVSTDCADVPKSCPARFPKLPPHIGAEGIADRFASFSPTFDAESISPPGAAERCPVEGAFANRRLGEADKSENGTLSATRLADFAESKFSVGRPSGCRAVLSSPGGTKSLALLAGPDEAIAKAWTDSLLAVTSAGDASATAEPELAFSSRSNAGGQFEFWALSGDGPGIAGIVIDGDRSGADALLGFAGAITSEFRCVKRARSCVPEADVVGDALDPFVTPVDCVS